jgi:hypothetical protein
MTSELSWNSGRSTPTTVILFPLRVMLLPPIRASEPNNRLPEAIAENSDRRLAGLVLLRKQKASEQRLGAEHRKQRRRSLHAIDPLGLTEAGERHGVRLHDGHFIEGVVFALNVEVLAGGRPIAEDADAGGMQPEILASRSG